MDVRQEFIERVNDAIDTQSHLNGEDHTGQEFVGFIPVPKALPPIDCNKVDDINLDNTRIVILEEGVIKNEKGEVIWDCTGMDCVVYKVTGNIRKCAARTGRVQTSA